MAIAQTAQAIISETSNDQAFLDQYFRNSKPGTVRNIQSALGYLREFTTKAFNQITPRDARAFCAYLDDLGKFPLKASSKHTYLVFIRSTVNEYLKWDAIERDLPEKKCNPFEVTEGFSFHELPDERGLTALDNADAKVLKMDEIKAFLKKMYILSRSRKKVGRCKFIVALLQVFCGPRISENVTIWLKNIDCKRRIWTSGLDVNAEKTGEVANVMPKTVAAIVSEYIADLPNGKYLFPGGDHGHVGIHTMTSVFSEIGFNSHKFRHTMETLQRKAGVDICDIEYLSNHHQDGVVAEKYIHYSVEDRIALYDKCLPKCYNEILDWLETL